MRVFSQIKDINTLDVIFIPSPGSCPRGGTWGLRGSKNYFKSFLCMVMWHIKLKEMISFLSQVCTICQVNHLNFPQDILSKYTSIWSRGQSEICGLFLKFVAPPRKKNLVATMSQGHVSGTWKTMFY